MRPSAALEMALALAEQANAFGGAGHVRLPSGVTLLLEVAAGEPAALNAAGAITTRSPAALQEAAAVFIERVMFAKLADSYRILGARRTATRKQLRRHMALLVKWLHRDEFGGSYDVRGTDHVSLFLRVTQAWENLKTDPRRAAYDSMLTQGSGDVTHSNPLLTAAFGRPETPLQFLVYKPRTRRASPRLVVYRIPNDTLFSRLLYYLGRQA